MTHVAVKLWVTILAEAVNKSSDAAHVDSNLDIGLVIPRFGIVAVKYNSVFSRASDGW